MRWYAGTSGYSYAPWSPTFYPEHLDAKDYLAHYATKLPAVEINNTFYRMPRTEVLANWRDAVPDGFRFVIKASQRITHQSRLTNCEDSVTYLCDRVTTLGDKLACVLFQLPPYLRLSIDRLRAFQAMIPEHIPTAIEFRHASWFCEEVFDALRARGHTLCVTDDGEFPLPDTLATSPMGYVRLRDETYSDAALMTHIERFRACHITQHFTFFKHEDAAAGPMLAARWMELTRGTEGTASALGNEVRAPRPPRAVSRSLGSDTTAGAQGRGKRGPAKAS